MTQFRFVYSMGLFNAIAHLIGTIQTIQLASFGNKSVFQEDIRLFWLYLISEAT